MPPPALTPTHEFLAVAGTAQPPNAAFLASLQDAAPLRIRDAHVLNVWLANLPADGHGMRRFTYREFYYVFLDHVIFEDLPLPLVLRPQWMGRFLRRLTDVGMPQTQQASLNALRQLASEWVAQLPDAERTVGVADIIDIVPHPLPAGWIFHATTHVFRNSTGLTPQLSQLACLIPQFFIRNGHTNSSFTRAQRLLASAAGAATLTEPEQADEVGLFLLRRCSSDDANPFACSFRSVFGHLRRDRQAET